jgi:hypothetical protein
VFDVILDKMNTALSLISGISPRHRERILQKVSRGMWAFPEEGYDLTLTPLTLYPKPLALNVAGSSSIYTLRTTQLLETHGIPCEFNPNGSQGILEWEINLAYKHVLHRLLPLVNLGDASSLDINEHFESLAKAYDILPGQVTCLDNAGSKSKKSSPFKDYTLTTLDLAILHQLHQLAQGASLNSVAEFLDTLIHKIQPSVMTSTSA